MSSSTQKEPIIVTRKLVADCAGVQVRWIDSLRQQGVLPEGVDGKWELVTVMKPLIQHFKDSGKEGSALDEAKLKLLNLKHAKESGEVVGVGEVKDQWGQMLAALERVLGARMSKKEYNAAIEELKQEWSSITGAVVF